jgi:hypothetical protein
MRRLILAIACFSLADLRNVECRSYCRFSAGYDSGIFSKRLEKCLCLDRIDNERLSEKRIILPGRIIKSKDSIGFVEHNPEMTEDVKVPYKLPWED